MRLPRLVLACALLAAAPSLRAEEIQFQQPQPPVVPETEIVAEPAPAVAPPIAPSEALNFPSLRAEQFGNLPTDPGGLNSAVRGNQSLLDASNLGTIVDQAGIREKAARDMFQSLQYEVGVLMQQTGRGQASPFLRGVTGQQVLVLIDGVRMNNATFRAGPNQYFNTVDPGQVERIEVLRGAGSVLWGGDAIGGVINIVTRSADPTAGDYAGGEFRSVYGSSDSSWYGRGNVEGWVGGQGVFGGGSYANIRDLDIGGGRGRQPFTNYDQYAADVKYNYLLSDDQLLTFAFSHFEQQDLPRSDRFPPFVNGPPANTPRPTYFDPQRRDLAYIRWQGNAYNPNFAFDVFSMTWSYSRNLEAATEQRSATDLRAGQFTDDQLGYTFALAKDNGDFGRLTYGLDYYYEDIDASRLRFNPSTPGAPPTTISPQYPDDALADRVGAFASWDVWITSRLNAVVGARYENADLSGTPRFTINGAPQDIFFERTYQDWIASVGLNYVLTEDWRLVGGVYESYRSPTVDDLTADNTFLQNAMSNPQLGSLGVQPEHSYTFEVGFKYDGGPLRLQVYEWWMLIDDYITRQTDGAGNVFLGNSEAYLNGTEATLEYLLPRNWSLYGNFAYTYGQDTVANVPYSRIPPMQGVAGVRWRSDDRRRYFDVFTWLVDRQDRYNPVNLTDSRFPVGGTSGYATLNLRAGTALGDSGAHRLNLFLENITDQYYRVLGSGVDGTGFNAVLAYEFYR